MIQCIKHSRRINFSIASQKKLKYVFNESLLIESGKKQIIVWNIHCSMAVYSSCFSRDEFSHSNTCFMLMNREHTVYTGINTCHPVTDPSLAIENLEIQWNTCLFLSYCFALASLWYVWTINRIIMIYIFHHQLN